MRYAHRVSYQLFVGDIPDEMLVDHSCQNRKCFNPEHLRLADKSQNAQNIAKVRPDSTTGIRGVQYNKQREKYQAIFNFQGKAYHVGYFDDKEEAGRRVEEERSALYTHTHTHHKLNS